MQLKSKIILTMIGVIVVGTGVALATNPDLYQGRIFRAFDQKPVLNQSDNRNLYNLNGKIVSTVASKVTSPVTSVVVSNVTSRRGTSRVASTVTTPVSSAVASAVVVDENTSRGTNIRELPLLTSNILQNIAKEDYKSRTSSYNAESKIYMNKHPQEFVLSQSAREKIIEMYKKQNPQDFTFRPAR